MANRYYVGDGGDYRYTTEWSDTDGGASGFSVPTLNDDVYFTANSFTTTGRIVTGGANNIPCKSFTCNGVLYAPTFNIGINAYGNITFCSGINWTYTNSIAIYRNCILITAGVILGSINIQSGTNITLDLDDNCRLSRSLVSTGTFIFNTNNYNFTAMDIKEGGTTGQATLNLGSSIITLAGPSVDGWSINPATMTGTFKIVMGGYYNLNQNFKGYGKTFNDVEFTGFYHTITGNNTFDKLSFNPVSYTVTDSYIKIQDIQTCTDLEGRGYYLNSLNILNNITNTSYEIKVTNNSSMQYIKLTRCTNSGVGTLTINNGINGGNNVDVIFVDSWVAGGSGTSGDPYLIENAYQLNFIRNITGTKYFRQVADIDVSADYPSWTPILTSGSSFFTGYYNGQLYEIQNLTNSLFGIIYGYTSQVGNIKIIDIDINTTASYVGALCGQLNGYTTGVTPLYNIYASGTIVSTGNYIGGIVGYYNYSVATMNLSLLCNAVNVTGNNNVGGILGGTPQSYGYPSPQYRFYIRNCENRGTIIGNDVVGGICGYYGVNSSWPVIHQHYFEISFCINKGIIKGVVGAQGILGGVYSYGNGCFVTLQINCSLGSIIARISGSSGSFSRISLWYTGYTAAPNRGLDTMILRRNGSPDTTFTGDAGNGINGLNITDANAKKQASYVGFTFSSSYWGIVEDTTYPYLYFWPHTYPPFTGFKIYLGAKQVTKIYKGAAEITEAYLGTKTLQ